MNREDLFKSIGGVDEEVLERSEVAAGRRIKTAWVKWATAAACLCLIVAGGIWKLATLPTKEAPPSEDLFSEEGITIPPLEVTLSKDAAAMADMIGFFIYEGRCYVYYENFSEAEGIVGEHLGTVTGMIDEWTPEEGYVDFAGSIRGDFYSVNGYAPEFMLCTKVGNGDVTTYICNNGITVKYGRELYEERLHLSENIAGVQYESRESWFYSKEELYELDKEEACIREFIEKLAEEEFLLCREVEAQEDWQHMVDSEIYHLYFNGKDGTRVHLRLHENGYVRFQGLWDLCVKIPEESYAKLLAAFAQNEEASE